MPLDKKRNNMNALKAGTTLQKGKYTISRVLGAGTFGITYMANTRVQMNGPLGQMDVTVDVAVKEFYMKDINVRTSDGANIEGTQNALVKDYRPQTLPSFIIKTLCKWLTCLTKITPPIL